MATRMNDNQCAMRLCNNRKNEWMPRRDLYVHATQTVSEEKSILQRKQIA